jgi:anti-sigma B factor antagonist
VTVHDVRLGVFVTHANGYTRVDVEGEVDLSTACELAERLALIVEADGGDVGLDMSKVSFCDSTGLKVLLNARRHMAADGRILDITSASQQLARLLLITGTSDLLASPSSH